MQTLSLSLSARGSEGEALPPVLHQLETLGARFRRGQVSLVAGAPGGGKSAIATHVAVNLDYTGQGDMVPGIYFSCDSDRMTLGTRVVAGVANIHLSAAESWIKEDSQELREILADSTEHIWWCWNPAPTARDIVDEIECYAYILGDWPHWVIIDNLMNMAGGGGDDGQALGAAIDAGHQISRETGAAVIFLHHVTGQYEDGDTPIPLSGLRFKVGKVPRLILTLHKPQDNILAVSVVKNSTGRAEANGSFMTMIPWIPEKSWFG